MSSVFVVAKLNRPVVSPKKIVALHKLLSDTLSPVSGLITVTAWRAKEDTEKYTLLTEYANEDEAAMGLEAVQESEFFIDATEAFNDPVDLIRSSVSFQHGCLGADVPVGQFMSVSSRTAEPGRAHELVAELSRIFGELASIEGYLGSMVGQNQTLEEEVAGIVFWDREEAFAASLPAKLPYEVNLYIRFA